MPVTVVVLVFKGTLTWASDVCQSPSGTKLVYPHLREPPPILHPLLGVKSPFPTSLLEFLS